MDARRPRHRPQSEVLERAAALRDELREALGRLPSDDPAVIDAIWQGEALGTLLWALQAIERLPSYDRPFDPAEVVETAAGEGRLRGVDELQDERESARLWHWRARTTALQAAGDIDLPERYASLDQLIAATAMRGSERGLLALPLRGDFPAYGKVYRHLSTAELAEAHSIALERHRALNWLCGQGDSWDDVPLDT